MCVWVCVCVRACAAIFCTVAQVHIWELLRPGLLNRWLHLHQSALLKGVLMAVAQVVGTQFDLVTFFKWEAVSKQLF
mgnify:CR=1 FL=1